MIELLMFSNSPAGSTAATLIFDEEFKGRGGVSRLRRPLSCHHLDLVRCIEGFCGPARRKLGADPS